MKSKCHYFILPLTLFFIFGMLFSFNFVGSSSAASAASLTGEFVFKKRAPKGALVYLPGDQSFSEIAEIDQINQKFTKIILVAPAGSETVFRNSDTVNHNIYADDKKAKVSFDIGLAPPGSEVKQKVTWEEGKIVIISCKIHPKMRAWIAAVSSKYHKVVEFKRKQKKAQIEIADIPDTFSKVNIWMSGYSPIEIDFSKKGTQTVDLIKKKKKRGTLTLTLK